MTKHSPGDKCVLVCDDDPSILELTQIVLEEHGYTVKVANHSRQIAPALHDPVPDLILLDLWFPEVGGVGITKQLKADTATQNIPIVIVSANKDAPKIAQQIGANGVLCKPFDLSELEEIADHYTA
jgi:CheY-like chemotaxis protein